MAVESKSEPYESPKIEAREAIDLPLVLLTSPPSAVFRPVTGYEPPTIERRDAIGGPLLATVGSPG